MSRFLATALAAWLCPSLPAHAGHEFPFYPSYYPQEITLSVIDPAGSPAKIADGSLHAYLGRDPYAGRPAPATVIRAESLAAYVVVALNPAARPPGRRRAPVRRRTRRGRGAGRRPRLPALSVSGDALPSRLPPARRPRHGSERERPRHLGRPAPARPSGGSRRHPARPSGAARHRRRLGRRGRDGGSGGAVGGGRRRAERQPRPAGAQDGLAPRLPGPPRRRGRSGDPAAGRRPPRAARGRRERAGAPAADPPARAGLDLARGVRAHHRRLHAQSRAAERGLLGRRRERRLRRAGGPGLRDLPANGQAQGLPVERLADGRRAGASVGRLEPRGRLHRSGRPAPLAHARRPRLLPLPPRGRLGSEPRDRRLGRARNAVARGARGRPHPGPGRRRARGRSGPAGRPARGSSTGCSPPASTTTRSSRPRTSSTRSASPGAARIRR